jgi:hypothetical protein
MHPPKGNARRDELILASITSRIFLFALRVSRVSLDDHSLRLRTSACIIIRTSRSSRLLFSIIFRFFLRFQLNLSSRDFFSLPVFPLCPRLSQAASLIKNISVYKLSCRWLGRWTWKAPHWPRMCAKKTARSIYILQVSEQVNDVRL